MSSLRPRSPYWSVGMSFVEPWVAVCQTNIGLLLSRCGPRAVGAAERFGHWRSLADNDLPIRPQEWAVGAAVVDPDGVVTASWGAAPGPGQPSRWVPIMMVCEADPLMCASCKTMRPTGCWVAVDTHGCSHCLPGQERHDPRRWPAEPDAPGQRAPQVKRKTPARRRPPVRTAVLASPAQGRLL